MGWRLTSENVGSLGGMTGRLEVSRQVQGIEIWGNFQGKNDKMGRSDGGDEVSMVGESGSLIVQLCGTEPAGAATAGRYYISPIKQRISYIHTHSIIFKMHKTLTIHTKQLNRCSNVNVYNRTIRRPAPSVFPLLLTLFPESRHSMFRR